MSENVPWVHPSVHAAYQANKTANWVSTTALYNKLDRVEPGVPQLGTRLSSAGGARGQGLAGESAPVVARLSNQGARW